MPKKSTPENSPRGYVLAVAVLVILVILLMAVPFMFKLSAQFRITEKSFKSAMAFHLAEAGIDRALWELNNWSVSPWVEGEDGVLTLTIHDMTTSDEEVVGDIHIRVMPPSGENRMLEAKGQVPFVGPWTVDRTVRVNLEKHLRSIFDFGFFAHQGIEAKTNLFVDSYDSREGAYGTGNERGTKGHTGTNNTQNQSIFISQGSSSEIYGNLASGFGTDPEGIDEVIDIPEGTDFRGEKRILPSEFEMPEVDLLNLPPRDLFENDYDFSTWYDEYGELDMATYYRGDFQSIKKETTILTQDDSGVYSSFEIVTNSTVRIEGNVALYITDPNGAEFLMKNNSSLEIADGSCLTLILGNTSFYMNNNTVQNSSQVPSNLIILGTDEFTGEMTWENNVDTHAAIYVPRAAVNFSNANVDLYGAVVCNYLEFKNNMDVHYDEALAELSWIKGGIPYWVVVSWQDRRAQ
ncbi:MAG: hypothetical protein ACLFVG_01720 [Candidatus Aminicenantes bacterium]